MSVHCQFLDLVGLLPHIVLAASSLIWWVVWKPRCAWVGLIDQANGSQPHALCGCDVCHQVHDSQAVGGDSKLPAFIAAHFLHEAQSGVPLMVGSVQTAHSPVPLAVWMHLGAMPGLSLPPFGLQQSGKCFANCVEVHTGPHVSYSAPVLSLSSP